MTIDDGEKSPTYANMKMLGFNTDLNASSANSPEELYNEFHTNMSQFREPPPYPGHSKQQQQPQQQQLPQCTQGGLRQSFSGSEASTDVSVSSTENLSLCQRQEPQGEETQSQQTCPSYDAGCGSDYSILARLGMPTSSLELCQTANTPQIYVTGNSSHGPHFATSPSLGGGNPGQGYYTSTESGFASASTSSSKLTWQDTTPTNQMFGSDRSPSTTTKSDMSSPASVSSYNSSTLYANYPFTNFSGMEPIQVPSGPPMLPQYLTSLPPPPEYPGIRNLDLLNSAETKRSYETIVKPEVPGSSRSQPDLTNFWESHSKRLGMFPSGSGSDEGSHNSTEQLSFTDSRYQDVDHIATQATRMVNVLTDENKALREKLFQYEGKVSKLQKFELEIQKIYEAYEALVRSSRKQEFLHIAMKKRMDDEVKSVKSQNEALRRQLDNAGVQITDHQLAQMDSNESNMVYLLAKHKEVLVVKERQDMDLEANRATIQEQKAQIEILRNVQTNVQRLEEECRRQQILSDSVDQLQQEMADMKTVYSKKEQTEKNIRQKLEKDVEYCRLHHSQGTLGRKLDVKNDTSANMKRILDEKEAKILSLEKELIQWKELHLEEQIRILKLQEQEASNEPCLPSYEQSSPMNTETLINEAKTEKLKQMEEVYNANRKVAELDARVKSLQSQLSEKEAIVRVYQRSPMTRSSSVHTIYCTPHHSPRPSLIASGGLFRQNSQDTAGILDIKHKKTGSSPTLETSRKLHLSQDDLFEKIQNLQSESKSSSDTEDTTEKNVWQV